MSEADEFMHPDQVRERLPFVISKREVRRRLRASGLCISHRNQIALPSDRWPAFLEMFREVPPSIPQIRKTGAARTAARVSLPGSADGSARAAILAAIAKKKK